MSAAGVAGPASGGDAEHEPSPSGTPLVSVAGSASEDGADREPSPSGTRIADALRQLGEIGGGAGGEVTRLAFTPADRRAHELVGEWMRAAGLTVRTDSFGNTIGEQSSSGAPYLALGSHLDSVPNGGRYDGIVGVVGALEVARMLAATSATATHHPLRVVAFANEEGARFGEACLGSKAIAGLLTAADADRLTDANGVTLAAAMASVGFRADRMAEARWAEGEVAAFLELHIEQGRTLESEGVQVGLVDAIAGNTRLRCRIDGRADHSGATRMHERRDALAAASEIVLAVEGLANERERGTTVATVGRLDVFPNSITTIPGVARLTIDVRDVDSDRQREAARDAIRLAEAICARRQVELQVEVISDTSPSILPLWLRRIAHGVCEGSQITRRVLSSGAGHDAQILARIVPAGMVFVPSREGLSHVPEEWTSVDDIAAGIRVLFRTLIALDRFLVELPQSA